ncbi:hypothetical protein AMJ50_00390 [Parcubacteria bacterium DG_74_3]|nr:MAG: hypothetical protein AMJ50_00390 [Parcubacteria bacterium DG_74_3]
MLPQRVKKLIGGVMTFLIAIIVILSFFGKAGMVGEKFMKLSLLLIGSTIYALPLFLALAGAVFLNTQQRKFLGPVIFAILILTLGISGIFSLLNQDPQKGGFLGYIFSLPLLGLFGLLVTKIIFFTLVIVGILIFWQLLVPSPSLDREKEEKTSVLTRVFGRAKRVPKFEVKEVPPLPSEKVPEFKPKAPPLELKINKVSYKPSTSKYKLPPLDLLAQEKETPSAGNTRTNAVIIKKTLENFGIPVEMAEINIGPTVTQYALKPAEGIKLSKITALSNNLALALASHPIRIEAPIPGRSLVGIEVPNKIRARVRLESLLSEPELQNSSSNLIFALGRGVSGKPDYADLAKMPHLLVAGATGTGKTIFLNNLILSFLYQNSPEFLRLILVDPKRVEFTAYGKLPHLLSPVIYDATKTVHCLNWLISEMGRRFNVLAMEKVRDIAGYNEKVLKEGGEFMSYIVLIIDELADLIVAKGREIETGIVRLAQLARAVGIHLVVATQRPSVEVITGLIKANITSRVSFQVASQIDSRTVLDMAGAEKLLGLGDLLFLSAQTVKPKRIQGPYVSDKEVKKVTNWIVENNQDMVLENGLYQDLRDSLEKSEVEGLGLDQLSSFELAEDPLYPETKKLVIETRRASASFLQRKLKIGYARAARLLDILEKRGIVGPPQGAKPREVYGGEDEPQEFI